MGVRRRWVSGRAVARRRESICTSSIHEIPKIFDKARTDLRSSCAVAQRLSYSKIKQPGSEEASSAGAVCAKVILPSSWLNRVRRDRKCWGRNIRARVAQIFDQTSGTSYRTSSFTSTQPSRAVVPLKFHQGDGLTSSFHLAYQSLKLDVF